jgi:hypothetical protein
MSYRSLFYAATVVAVACWLTVTGLSVEKMLKDGVQSYTLLFAMPVFVGVAGWLIHQAVDDLRNWRLIRPLVAAGLAALTLSVTLPNSIGSSGSAKDAEVAQAQASGRGLAFSQSLLDAAADDLKDAKGKVTAECLGAPEVITPGTWPKCSWWRRQVEAHTLAVEKYGKGVVDAPVEQQALSGEKRIAWALSGLGVSVAENDVQMAQPIATPLAGELLCAFFTFMAFEYRRLWRKEEERAKGVDNSKPTADATEQAARAAVVHPRPAIEAPQPVPAVADKVPSALEALASIPERSLLIEEAEEPDSPPPTGRKRRKVSKKELKKARVFSFGNHYFARHGYWPSTGKIAGQFHLPASTASSYRKQMIAEEAA